MAAGGERLRDGEDEDREREREREREADGNSPETDTLLPPTQSVSERPGAVAGGGHQRRTRR